MHGAYIKLMKSATGNMYSSVVLYDNIYFTICLVVKYLLYFCGCSILV